eukprot:11141916-Ditylum_brightwellii.AAC.1
MTIFVSNQTLLKKLFLAVIILNRATSEKNPGLRRDTIAQTQAEGGDSRSLVPLPLYPSLPEGPEEISGSREEVEDNVQKKRRRLDDEVMPRIINGYKAMHDSFPYYTLMLQKTSSGRLRRKGCGATLIEDEWILTAAHCYNQAGDIAWIGAYNAGIKEKKNTTMLFVD